MYSFLACFQGVGAIVPTLEVKFFNRQLSLVNRPDIVEMGNIIYNKSRNTGGFK